MALDIKRHREKIKDSKPGFNLVPLIDILFTILIFLVVTSSFVSSSTVDDSGKPNATDSQGPSQYYLFPVAGLEKVIVNGQDMSQLIRANSIAIHTKVIDKGTIEILATKKTIIITTPSDVSIDKAVQAPN